MFHQKHVMVLGHLINSFPVTFTFMLEHDLVDLSLTNRIGYQLVDLGDILLNDIHLDLVPF